MKKRRYSQSADFNRMNLFQREHEIYSQIKIDRRKFKINLAFFFVVLAIIAYIILSNPSKKTISPISILDKEQTAELQSYHSDKGFVTVDDGYIIIKK